VNNVKWELPKNGDLSYIFNILDNGVKIAEMLNFIPFRNEGIKAGEKWILERQEATGNWEGIIPAMLNSLLSLKCLDYDANDPIIYGGLKAVDNVTIETENSYCV
jgi:squalene-hopene/tetraprenyl-beta-curcumene cyclase